MNTEERMVVENFVHNEEFFQKTLPHIHPEYFSAGPSRIVMTMAIQHGNKYGVRVPKEALLIEAARLKISEQEHDQVKELVTELASRQNVVSDITWAVDATEKFCKDRAMINAIMNSIEIVEGSDKKRKISDIYDLVSQALAVSFDTRVGHDFFEDFSNQFDFYTLDEVRIPFDIEMFNTITKGGLTAKTVNVFMSTRTGGFKSGTMCHLAARWMLAGYDVLYITMEMSEQRIRERIDANLLNVKIDDLRTIKKDWYEKRLQELRAKTPGKLIIKEYPTGLAHCGHFRYLLKELRSKKGFRPKIVLLDYLNICASQTYSGSDVQGYVKVKSITEEFRGLAVEFDFAGVSATQSNRSGVSAGDSLDVDDVSESYGLPMTVDLMVGIISTDELTEKGLLMFKQLKNRYADEQINRKFCVGVDKSRMLLFDADDNSASVKAFIPPSEKRTDSRTKQSFDTWKFE